MTVSHEPFGLLGVASSMTSTLSSSAVSWPGPQLTTSGSPSRVRIVSSPSWPRTWSTPGESGAAVAEDPALAGPAVLHVVAEAAGHQVRAALAVDGVVAGAAEQEVPRVATVDRVVAGTAPDAVAAVQVADPRHVAAQRVVALV